MLLSLLLLGCGPLPDRFALHYVESDPNRIFSPRYLGVPTWQNPMDLWVMQELITEIRPDFVIETGTQYGGSALYYSSILEQVHPSGRVISIDIQPQAVPEATENPLWQRVDAVISDALDAEMVAEIRSQVSGKRVLVTLDSMHGADFVAREIALYAPLVSVGSYLVVQDTAIDKHRRWIRRYTDEDRGPTPAVEAFLQANPSFQRDSTRDDKFLFTFHPGGWLRRVSE